ncbi:MAG: cell division ATPase MinD [Halobacteriota archaeon]|nr:cell division ATPase MinD [Halobacteriota archaeon]
MTKIFGITSGKGGVGKSTVVASLGVLLSRMGKRTLIIDADIAMGSLQLILGLQNTPITLHEVLTGEADVEEAIYNSYDGLHVMPCSSSLHSFLRSDLNVFEDVVSKLNAYDFILVDDSAGLTKYSLAPLKVVEETLLVVTPDLPSISAALRMKIAAGMSGSKVTSAIINKQRRTGIKGDEIRSTLGIEILGEIPQDNNVLKSLDAKMPIVEYKPKSPASKAFNILSLKIAGEIDELMSQNDSSFVQRFIQRTGR